MPSVKVALASSNTDGELIEGDVEYEIHAECSGDAPDDVIFAGTTPASSMTGELFVSGLSVFSHYWNRPDATRDSFTADGLWFKTGDTAVVEDGIFKIFGRFLF